MSLFNYLAQSMVALSLVTVVQSAEPLTLSKQYWSDQSFVKSFNGSYRINARIEPSVTSVQRAILVQVQELMKAGNRQAALGVLSKSSETKKSAALRYNQGNIYFELGELEMARSSYSAAIKAYPSFRRAHANLGMVLLREENYRDALTSLVEAVGLGDVSGSTMGMLGYCHLQNEHFASALQAYRMAQMSQPTQVDWQAGIAQCLSEMDQNAEAVALLEEIVEKRPAENSYQLLLVNVLLSDGQDDAAVVVLEWLRRNERLNVRHLALLAQLHTRADNMKLAKPVFSELIPALDGELLPGYLTAVETVLSAGDWDYAEELLNSIPDGLELPQDIQHRSQRLKAMVLAKFNKPGAEKILTSVIKSNPLDGEALLQLGVYYVAAEDYERAAIHFERAKDQEKVLYRTLLAYSQMFVAQKRYRLAIEQLEQADQLQSSPEQRKYLSVLQGLVE